MNLNFYKILSKVWLAVLIVNLPVSAESLTTCLEKTCFSQSSLVGSNRVPLVGLTKFEYLYFDVYTLALYALPDSSKPDSILENNPKRLVFHYHRDISRDQMIEGAAKNLATNPSIKVNDIQTELDELNAHYVDVKEGDRYELAYDPSRGTTLSLNGKELVTVSGPSFAAAYFGIWLSQHPISVPLRNRLLSGKVPAF